MSGYIDPLAVLRTTGPDPFAVDPAKSGVVIDPAQYGPSDLAVNVSPPKFDPNNPLGLTAAAPGYLPPELRTPKRDPDLGWSAGDGYMPTGLGQPDLSVDERNALTKAQVDWAKMDEAYWKPREQNPLPLVLGAAGLIAAPFALSALGIGAAGAAGGAGSAAGAAGAAGGAGLASGATAGALGAGALGAGAGTTVSELVVTAAAQGLSIPAIAAAVGIPAATVSTILSNSGGSNVLQGSQGGDTLTTTPAPTEVDPLTVTGPAPVSSIAGPVAATLGGVGALGALSGGGGGGGGGLGDYTGAGVPSGVDPATGTNAGIGDLSLGRPAPTTLLNAIKSGDLGGVGDWIKANPLQAVQLGLLSASALSTVTGGGKPSSASGVYTPVSLPASFSATSPRFALAGRGDPRLMPSQDWTKYGLGPEQSFFTGVDQPAPITDLTVRVPDRIHPKPKGYAEGGSVVNGTPNFLSIYGAKILDKVGDLADQIPAQILRVTHQTKPETPARGASLSVRNTTPDWRDNLPLSMDDAVLDAYRADPTNRFGGGDGLETLPTKLVGSDLYTKARDMASAKALGAPQMNAAQLASLALKEGRSDFGTNTANGPAGELAKKYMAAGITPDDANFLAALQVKRATAQRLGIPFGKAWNGSGVNQFGQSGANYAVDLENQTRAARHPRNRAVLAVIQRGLDDGAKNPVTPHSGYAHGGFAVRGEGDGRSDSIDAKLSDGEYVMDAETVALLGNGSNKAGADKLDQFRVNLRRDKGRKLARGEFSVHAKDPMAYAQGGR